MATELVKSRARKSLKPTGFGAQKQDALAQMNDELAQIRQTFRDQVKDHYRTAPPMRESRLSTLHQAFAMQNALAVIEPLRRNVSLTSVVRSAGIGIALYALSPQFKEEFDRVAGNVRASLPHALREAEKKKWELQLAGLKGLKTVKTKLGHDGASDDVDAIDPRDVTDLATRNVLTRRDVALRELDTRIALMEDRIRGRVPYSAEAVGLTHMALDEELYDVLRMPGISDEAKQLKLADHQAMVSDLYRMGVEDGLSVDTMDATYRAMVHDLVAVHPQAASMWQEMSLDGGGVDLNGNIRDVHGRRMFQGVPTVRQPLGMDEHRSLLSDVIYTDLIKQGTPAELTKALVGYSCAWASTSSNVGDLLLASAPDEAVAVRMMKGRTYLQAAADDGLSISEQQTTYKGALMDALESVGQDYPDKLKPWETAFGPNWRQEIERVIDDPQIVYSRLVILEEESQKMATPQESYAHPQGSKRYAEISGRSSRYTPEPDEPEVIDGELIDDDEFEF